MLGRRKTRSIYLDKVGVGSDFPISVQSMTNTKTENVKATLEQINQLIKAGCEIIRVAVPNEKASIALAEIKRQISIPLIADIHFDYQLALKALEAGVDGLRINPGNIGSEEKVALVVKKAQDKKVPIRIGVNGGSLEKDLLRLYGKATAETLVESALRHIRLLEKLNFNDIKISLKSSDIPLMLEAYQILAKKVDYPLHIGVTESGTLNSGIVKSAVGIGALLSQGIGDTLRVSLTGDPVYEVKTGFDILKALGLRKKGIELISCPTCGRTEIDLISLAKKVEERLKDVEYPLKVAVMGCVVNGPGEASQADIGIAGGKGNGLIFKMGKVLKTVPEGELLDRLFEEVEKILEEQARKM